MAEVIEAWPGARPTPPAMFEYPWDQWTLLDDNGHGDIWLASRGVDFPARTTVLNFRGILYNRASRVTKIRERDAPTRLMRVRGTNKVRRIPDYRALKVKVRIVSEEQVAFQFYDSPQPPPNPAANSIAVPGRRPARRTPLHRPIVRRTYETASV